MKDIHIKIIPYAEMRYPSLGDYWIDGDNIEVRISGNRKNGEALDEREIAGIILHELTELFIVLHRGIDMDAITVYDKAYKGSDPGTNPKAPYHREHMTAMEVEELFYDEVELG
jgi:hypothetical protein